MKFDVYFVDAFTDSIFSGNPAAVIFTDLDDKKLMQKIASENNLSETAFVNISNDINSIRWFSPVKEVDLCGHATLASGFVYFNFIKKDENEVSFMSASGELSVRKTDDLYELNFPKDNIKKINLVDEVEDSIGIKPIETYIGDINLFALLDSEDDLRTLTPNFNKLINLEGQGLIVSSRSKEYDFVSRYFCPKYGINEDPVTGSAHTTLIPYWSEKLNSEELVAKQVSERGGVLYCKNKDTRVLIAGKAVLFMKGEIELS
tara:strand:+ start:385 stop:1167 length:783 start_codon:yes stop_codon:yes gene_type:complete